MRRSAALNPADPAAAYACGAAVPVLNFPASTLSHVGQQERQRQVVQTPTLSDDVGMQHLSLSDNLLSSKTSSEDVKCRWVPEHTKQIQDGDVTRSERVPAQWDTDGGCVCPIELTEINMRGGQNKMPPCVHDPLQYGDNGALLNDTLFTPTMPSNQAWVGLSCGHMMLAYSYQQLILSRRRGIYGMDSMRENMTQDWVFDENLRCPLCRQYFNAGSILSIPAIGQDREDFFNTIKNAVPMPLENVFDMEDVAIPVVPVPEGPNLSTPLQDVLAETVLIQISDEQARAQLNEETVELLQMRMNDTLLPGNQGMNVVVPSVFVRLSRGLRKKLRSKLLLVRRQTQQLGELQASLDRVEVEHREGRLGEASQAFIDAIENRMRGTQRDMLAAEFRLFHNLWDQAIVHLIKVNVKRTKELNVARREREKKLSSRSKRKDARLKKEKEVAVDRMKTHIAQLKTMIEQVKAQQDREIIKTDLKNGYDELVESMPAIGVEEQLPDLPQVVDNTIDIEQVFENINEFPNRQTTPFEDWTPVTEAQAVIFISKMLEAWQDTDVPRNANERGGRISKWLMSPGDTPSYYRRANIKFYYEHKVRNLQRQRDMFNPGQNPLVYVRDCIKKVETSITRAKGALANIEREVYRVTDTFA